MVSRVASLDQVRARPDVQHLARDLGATYVVSGGCQVVGERMRISLRLVRPDGAVVAGFPAEGPRDRLFDLQRTLALQVAEFVRGTGLSASDRTRLARRPTTNLDAFDALQHRPRPARAAGRRAGNVLRAIESLRARNHARSELRPRACRARRSRVGAVSDQRRSRPGRRAPRPPPWRRAISIRSSPEVRYTLRCVFQGIGQTAQALDELRAAVDLQPNYDDAYRLRGEILARLGRWDDAFESLQKAIDVRPNYWGNYRSLGLAYRDAGRLDSALTAFQRIVDLVPDNAWGYQLLGTIYQQQGTPRRCASPVPRTACSTAVRRRRCRIWAICTTRRAITPTRCACSRRRRSCVPDRPRRSATSATRCDACAATSDARAAYERAAALSEEEVRVNPGDAHAHARGRVSRQAWTLRRRRAPPARRAGRRFARRRGLVSERRRPQLERTPRPGHRRSRARGRRRLQSGVDSVR